MNEEKIEQHVIVSDEAQTGDITLIGKIVYIVKHPSEWQEAIWRFLSTHRYFAIGAIVLEAILAVVYLKFSNLYLISSGLWILAASLLLAAAWGWYTWGRFGHSRARLVFALAGTLSLGSIIGSQTWRIVFPERFEPQVFGIAVAELGEGPGFYPTAQAREITGQVYEHLCEALRSRVANQAEEDPCRAMRQSSLPRRVEMRRIGVVPDRDTAQAYGERIRADFVIWGQVLTSERGGVTIRFQVLETPDREVRPGFPLVLPITATSTDIVIRELDLESDPVKLKEIVAHQATVISSFTLAVIAYLERDYPEAVTRFEAAARAIDASPSLEISAEGRGLLYFYLGRANHAMGRIEAGQKWLKRAESANQQEPAVPLGLALGAGSLGQDREKSENLRSALKLVDAWLETHPDDNAATYDRGVMYQARGEPAYAALDYEAVVERDPGYYIAYISLGQVAAELRDYEKAIDSLQAAIALAETTGANAAWAHLNLAVIYEAANEPELAKGQYLEAIALAPEVDSMYAYYAPFLERRQEMDAALLAYRKLTKVAWNKGWAYGSLAAFFKRRGLLEEALASYQRAVHAQPEDPLLRAYLAETYFALGDADRAVQEFEKAIEYGEDIYYVFASYGGALFQLGKFELAARMYERSLELRPIDHPVMLNLGQTYEQLGRDEKAKALYLRILSLKDQCPESAIAIARDRLRALGVKNP